MKQKSQLLVETKGVRVNSAEKRSQQHDPGVSRRDFLRLGAAATAGLATGSIWLPKSVKAFVNETSRVVIVRDDQAMYGPDIQSDIVRIMVDAGIKALTDAATPADAWQALFPELSADLGIGIKVNLLNPYPYLSTHPEVAYPIAESLAETPIGSSTYPENKILIWDRVDSELDDWGYTINDSSEGIRCFGSNHAGVGYSAETLNINGSNQHVSRCYIDHSDNLINLGCLKNHSFSGVTGALKNHFGTVDHPEYMHLYNCDPYIPELNSELIDQYGEKQKLCICDAIMGIFSSGPVGPPEFIYNGIIMSTDPVALDVILLQILEEYGCTTGGIATHIGTASQPPYNLGNSDPVDIEIIEIENPSAIRDNNPGVQPDRISLGRNYPEPFNSGTTIPLTLDRPADVQIEVYNLAGRKVSSIYKGSLQPGRHEFDWNGKLSGGTAAPSGKYIVGLGAGKARYSRRITLLK